MNKIITIEHKMASKRQFKCPHCFSALAIRSSREEHAILKSLWFQCSSVHCGFTCGGHIEITHTISPSATPNPAINLPTLKELLDTKAANDEI